VSSNTFYPQTDGEPDKPNLIIKTFLRAFSINNQKSWNDCLSIAEFAYNYHTHQLTNLSPLKSNLGYIPRILLDSLATIYIRQLLIGYPDISFTIYLANIFQELQSALAGIQEYQIFEITSYCYLHLL
jgi:hypothetical protein